MGVALIDPVPDDGEKVLGAVPSAPALGRGPQTRREDERADHHRPPAACAADPVARRFKGSEKRFAGHARR